MQKLDWSYPTEKRKNTNFWLKKWFLTIFQFDFQTIKDIAGAIRDLLDVLKDMIRENARNRAVQDVLERGKREFVKASKQFSDSLKQYFQDRSHAQQSGVFKSANNLSHQTNLLLMSMANLTE